jgi:hypothetical protein
MIVGAMQPYLFPYIGYYQLANKVDMFVFLDDVNFINKGWINRNNILVNKQKYVFTIPLSQVSQNKLIKDVEVDSKKQIEKVLKTIQQSYQKAKYFSSVFPVVKQVLLGYSGINEMAQASIIDVFGYLGKNLSFESSTLSHPKNGLASEERIISICENLRATKYVNAIGGTELYQKDSFSKKSIELKFLKTHLANIKYSQFSGDFVPGLSMIDVMMHNSREEILKFLNECVEVDAG